jgi:ribonuclease P protein component
MPAGTHTLRRQQRLTESDAFEETFKQGRRFVGRTMVLWRRDADDASLRLGVVASKRTFRRAVDRNRAKRVLRETWRLNREQLGGGSDVVLVARRRLLSTPTADVARELRYLAKKAGLGR